MATRNEGFVLYLDQDNDNQYRDTGCLFVAKWPGKSRDVFDEEVCLDATAISQGVGPLKYTPFTGELEILDPATDTIYSELHTAMDAGTAVNWAVKLNYSTPVYVYFTGILNNLDPVSGGRETTIKYAIEIVVTSNPNDTVNTTEPTLEA